MKPSADVHIEPRRAWVWPAAATVAMGVALCLRWWFGRGKEPVRRYEPPPPPPPDGGLALEPVPERLPVVQPPPTPPAPEREPERELQPVG